MWILVHKKNRNPKEYDTLKAQTKEYDINELKKKEISGSKIKNLCYLNRTGDNLITSSRYE